MGELPSCPACTACGMQIFFRLENVPVHQNLPLPTREAAQQCVRGDIVLGFCPVCGFVSNLAFEPGLLEYSPQYDNSQSFSPLFWDYLQDLAVNLVSRYELYNKTIIEIGCGKGEFLTMLCELGHNRGIGFDPSYVEGSGVVMERVTFIRDFYSERYANCQGDLVCSRHVLEHVQYPAELIASLRRSIGDRPGTVVFFEVPDVTWILHNLTFWDIFYEHCSYFSPGSLARLFTTCGFYIVGITKSFGGQYLWLEAFPRDETEEAELAGMGSPQEIAHAATRFAVHCRDKMETVRRQLFDGMERSGRRCVIWGAGAKGVTVLNTLDIPPERIEFVVDINPRKQWMYVPGTGQQIVPTDFLKTYLPEAIFVMNPNYLDEIRDTIADLGISAELVSL